MNRPKRANNDEPRVQREATLHFRSSRTISSGDGSSQSESSKRCYMLSNSREIYTDRVGDDL